MLKLFILLELYPHILISLGVNWQFVTMSNLCYFLTLLVFRTLVNILRIIQCYIFIHCFLNTRRNRHRGLNLTCLGTIHSMKLQMSNYHWTDYWFIHFIKKMTSVAMVAKLTYSKPEKKNWMWFWFVVIPFSNILALFWLELVQIFKIYHKKFLCCKKVCCCYVN